jgi:hypothetical protein
MHIDKGNRLYIIFLKPLLADFQRVNILFQHSKADQFRLFDELKYFVICISCRIPQPSAVSLNVNLDFWIYYLPLDQAYFGRFFISQLSQVDLPIEANEEIKVRCHSFLKVAARSVLKRFPLAFESLLKLRILSPRICFSQAGPKFAELLLSAIPMTEFGDIENQWRRLLEVDWNEHYSGELPKDSSEFWAQVLQFRDPIGKPLFKDLAKWALSLLRNAYVERAFSMMSCIKSKLRNRMLLPMLNVVLIFGLWISVSGQCCSSFVPLTKMMSFASRINRRNNSETISPDPSEEKNEIVEMSQGC